MKKIKSIIVEMPVIAMKADMLTLGVSEEFQTYTIEWLPDKIMGYINDELYFTFEPAKDKLNTTYKEWPFDKRMHLLLNLSVGGNWGGARGVDESIYPRQMVVEYVRVYQSKEITEMTKNK